MELLLENGNHKNVAHGELRLNTLKANKRGRSKENGGPENEEEKCKQFDENYNVLKNLGFEARLKHFDC